VRITLAGGEVLSAKVDRPLGRTSDNPIPLDNLKAKFRACAMRALDAGAAAAVAGAIDAFENLESLGSFTALLERAGGREGDPAVLPHARTPTAAT